ncbi:N-6 DNA methylase [Paenibacillus sonchi]|uniref:N-6 DNA methylase n=2 Tax=Paenibacillus sonchi TaxID=373687 RepID=A0A974PCZ3_9BACL|nr:N-6 DNA methylase [Paenibacillus sonchi]
MPEIDDGAEKHTAEEMLEYLLRSDQGKSVIKPRIYQFVTEQHPVKPAALVSLLKVVYGIGGAWGSFANDLKGYMTNSKGMELEWKEADGTHREGLTWNRVAAMILQLIQEGRYDEQFAPFPLEEPEWTLFDFAEQQSHEEKQELDIHSMESVEILPKLSEEDTATVPIPPSEAKEDAFEEGTFNSEPSSIADPIHAVNYRFNPEASPYVSGPKSKYKRNVEAIRLLKHLEADQRQATPEEQQILAGYVGWGGLANAFHSTASGWEGEYTELKQLLDNEEYDAARNSTITAFYTEQSVIQPIYTTLQRFGLTDGIGRKLLEPSMGTGNFFSVLPPEWNQAELHGVELDQLTGRISRQLYPQATVHLQGFETVDWRNTRFDAVFSNIPFNNIRIFDQHYQSNHLIHDYFFIKALDLLKPGGVLAFIVSKGTMDKQDSSVREILAQKADLIGAVRLPNTTFQVLAGTTVTTDIVFLQKREQPLSLNKEDMPEWVFIGTTSDGIPINRYYLSNPDHLLGRMIWDRGMHGVEQTACVPDENQQLYDVLEQALERLQAVIPSLPPSESESKPSVLIDTDEPKRLEAPAGTKNFTYIIEQGQIYYCEMGELFPQNIKGKKAERIKGLCEIRTALLEVISLQSREYGYEETELTAAQHTLNSAYDRFVDSCGYINDRANTAAFADDDQLPLLRSIEDLNPEKTWSKAAIFFRPTIRSNHLPDHAESAIEALQICLNQRLRIDLPYMAHLCRTTTAEIREELGERIFLNPQNYTGDEEEGWELDEDYLSGNVKDKLAYAILKAKELPDLFQRNVSALTTVQPAPLLPGEIDFRIGSPWIPVQYYREFMYEIFGTAKVLQTTQTVDLDYLEFTNLWRVSGKSLERDSIKVNQTYGTRRASAYEIYESSLNLQSITIRDPFTFVDSSGNEQIKYVVNAKETMIARAKQQQMKEAFASWLFRDKDRTDNLLAIYNDKFNNIRPRHYNGDHLVFAGMNEEMHLRKHQKDVVARILYSGTALMAHEVGAGKTAAMITAGMMLKRIGAIQKPMYCVPNHLTEQWANEFLRFFPAANILVTTKKDFALANRQRFVSRIAMGNYDAVIIGHSQFEKIPISSERQEQLLQDEIRNVSQTIDQVKKEKGDNWSIKQMVVFENNLKSRLERLANEGKKDDLLTFEQLGVDMLFVDEAHAYKNCFTFTKMRNVAGIGKTSSQRATDMLLKCQYLQEMNSGRGVVFATGTPISNSISEMYVMQRFLQTHLLQKLGLNFFDNWAATFGEVVSSLEITPEGSGYRMKSRFAKFHNLPELLNLFRLVADIQTADMLQLPTPKLEGDKATVIISECSPFQQQLMDEFVVRAEQIRNNDVDASEDNMLKLTHEAKLMSIDPRLVHEDAPVDPDSKLNRCIHNLYYIWQQTETEKLTQVVFCDSGTPKPGVFNVYDEVKSQLILRGVPEDDIAFIHDAKTDAQREELFERVRRGEVRILLGSTSKLGTGTNIQDRLIAAHHTDCPWRPSDIIQRDGRILRQGNRNPVVQIFRYVTKGTFDSYLWQIQEQKLRYISQVMTGKVSPAPVKIRMKRSYLLPKSRP